MKLVAKPHTLKTLTLKFENLNLKSQAQSSGSAERCTKPEIVTPKP